MPVVSRDEDADALFTLRRERRLTRTHAALWTVIVAATVADVLLTMRGLALGYREGNAVVGALLSTFGLAGLWLVKFAAMVWLVVGWAVLSDRDAAVFLALFALVTLVVVAHNAVVLFG
ncbi:DUF5658 family protein [Haloarcula litorea]|uniref:DUF5658 family protein n=1 Tax=Haloarcula litorea TaxID=3032579 RepID=UPI0023E82E58|nr:DUF5658 family protein [Halomicroarcula sp. GDY20]